MAIKELIKKLNELLKGLEELEMLRREKEEEVKASWNK